MTGRFSGVFDTEFTRTVVELAEIRSLAPSHRDHAFFGPWTDHRDGHVRPDRTLFDRKPAADHFNRVRPGTCSEFGL